MNLPLLTAGSSFCLFADVPDRGFAQELAVLLCPSEPNRGPGFRGAGCTNYRCNKGDIAGTTANAWTYTKASIRGVWGALGSIRGREVVGAE